jgi:hypothetical protein
MVYESKSRMRSDPCGAYDTHQKKLTELACTWNALTQK